MRKIRSLSELQAALDGELSWRVQEIHSLKKLIAGSDGQAKVVALRASIPLLYAHWEGFIKSTSFIYASYLSRLNLKYKDIHESFRGLQAISYVKELNKLTKSIFASSEIVRKIYAIDDDNVFLPINRAIENVGNLNYDLFIQIVAFFGFGQSVYSTKKALIDEALLAPRNDIAHGAKPPIEPDSFESLADEVLAIMRMFEADIANAALLKTYLKAAA